MMRTRSLWPRYSGEAMMSTIRPFVCDGAVVNRTRSGIVMGLVLRA